MPRTSVPLKENTTQDLYEMVTALSREFREHTHSDLVPAVKEFEGQGALATSDDVDFATEVTGTEKPDNNADVTGDHAADINVLLTQNAPAEAGAQLNADLPPDTNLSLYWPLDERIGAELVNDLTEDDNDGIMNGTMTAADWVAGVSGTALDLDGTDDYLSVATPTFIDNTQGAVSLWVKLDTLTTQQTIWSVSVDGSTDDEFSLFFRGDSNKELEVALLVNGAAQFDQTSAANAINDNNWHHIVLQSDGSTIKLYVDSVLQTLSGTGTNSGQWLDDATQANIFTVGVLKRAALVVPLDGRVDEVRVYSDDLTAKQIEALYKSPAGNKQGFSLAQNEYGNISIGIAGETITISKWLCTKSLTTDYTNCFEAQDYQQANPDTTGYGDADRLYLNGGGAGSDIETVIKILTTSFSTTAKILKAELYLYFNGVGVEDTVTFYLLTSAFNPATVTWNTKPTFNAAPSEISQIYGASAYALTVSASGWKTIDITQLLRHWVSGNLTNNGFVLKRSIANDFYIHRYDHASNKMYLRITTINADDGKLYLADNDNYATCRSIAGQALTTTATNAIVKYQFGGSVISSGLNAGEKYYLSNTAGNETDTPNAGARAIKLYETITDKVKIFDIQRNDILIEKLAVSYLGGSTATYGTSYRIYVPLDARKAVIQYKISTDSAAASDVMTGTLVVRCGQSENNVDTFQHWDNVSEARDISATWSNTNPPYITVTRTDASVVWLSIEELYLYN